MAHQYVIQRRFQTELAKKVGGALDKIFEHIDGNSLHILEEVSVIESPKPLPKGKIKELCAYLLEKTREEGDKETLSFECVHYKESMRGIAERRGGLT